MYPKRPDQLSCGLITQTLTAPANAGSVLFQLSWVYNRAALGNIIISTSNSITFSENISTTAKALHYLFKKTASLSNNSLITHQLQLKIR